MLGNLTSHEIEQLLQSQILGRIGCHAEGKTFVVPIAFAYDGKYLYGHSKEGMKVDMMRRNPKVCFEVDKMENMANWQSVIVQGEYEELFGDLYIGKNPTPERNSYLVLRFDFSGIVTGQGKARFYESFDNYITDKVNSFLRKYS